MSEARQIECLNLDKGYSPGYGIGIGEPVLNGPSRVVLNGTRKRVLSKGVIFRQGDRAQSAYRIRRGMIKLLGYLPNGRARIVRLHTAGHWIGLGGLYARDYEHTAIVIDDADLEHFSIPRLLRLSSENPDALGELMFQWHSDLVQADKWISDFSTGGIESRVARLLRFLAVFEYGELSDKVGLLKVQEMAEILGVTPESVSRVIAAFKRRGTLRQYSSNAPETYRLDDEMLQRAAWG